MNGSVRDELRRITHDYGVDGDLVDFDMHKNAATTLCHHIYNRDLRHIMDLVNTGVSPDASMPIGTPPLVMAANIGFYGAVNFLLASGASIDDTDMLGNTALHMAARGGHVNVVKLLCQSGANLWSLNRMDETPLDMASDGEARRVILDWYSW